MSPWLKAGLGVVAGFVLYKYVLRGGAIRRNGSILAGPIEANGSRLLDRI